jgi:hypothetical protein
MSVPRLVCPLCSGPKQNPRAKTCRACYVRGIAGRRPFDRDAAIARFLANVKIPDDPDDCWTWMGHTLWGGYGQFNMHGTCTTAHRAAYILFVGDMPEGTEACHTCDNPPCVNPSHVFPGTHSDNVQDCIRKGRFFGGLRKLSDAEVVEIRALLAETDLSLAAIGERFGVHAVSVFDIKHGRTHKRVA